MKLSAEAVDDADCARKKEEKEVIKEAEEICRSFSTDYVAGKSDDAQDDRTLGLRTMSSPLLEGTTSHHHGDGDDGGKRSRGEIKE